MDRYISEAVAAANAKRSERDILAVKQSCKSSRTGRALYTTRDCVYTIESIDEGGVIHLARIGTQEGEWNTYGIMRDTEIVYLFVSRRGDGRAREFVEKVLAEDPLYADIAAYVGDEWVFPAYAGVIPRLQLVRSLLRCVPRVRGGD
jgi:hypothetical protein